MHFVYIFKHGTEPIIKVGHSSAPWRRRRAWRAERNFGYGFAFDEEEQAFQLEQEILQEYRELKVHNRKFFYSDEIFHVDTLPMILDFIRKRSANRPLFGVRLTGVPVRYWRDRRVRFSDPV
jgi:hypothetical protein